MVQPRLGAACRWAQGQAATAARPHLRPACSLTCRAACFARLPHLVVPLAHGGVKGGEHARVVVGGRAAARHQRLELVAVAAQQRARAVGQLLRP